jgi:hypothetical protein
MNSERVIQKAALIVYMLYRPMAALGYGVAISATHGWARWFLLLTAVLFTAEGALMTFRKRSPRQSPERVLVNHVTLTDEEAAQVMRVLEAAASKQRPEQMQ